MDAAWYMADRLGQVMQQNPDLHKEIVFRNYFRPNSESAGGALLDLERRMAAHQCGHAGAGKDHRRTQPDDSTCGV